MTPIDVDSWVVMQVEPEGQDARKAWLADRPDAPHAQWWLWKPSLITEGRAERRLTHVAEFVATRLAAEIDLPSAHCLLATRSGEIGVISRNFSPPPWTLIHGAAFMPIRARQRLDDIAEALSGVAAPDSCPDMTALEVFTGYLTLDAWISNTDRHERNWAVLEGSSGNRVLAPSFDHGTALGSGMTDERRASRSVPHFCVRGRAGRFEGGHTLLDLAHLATIRTGTTLWAERITAVPPGTWRVILDDIDGLSVAAYTFMDAVLTTNQERVSALWRPCP